MVKGSRIPVFLLVVPILFWNPLVFRFSYSGSPVEDSFFLRLVSVVVPCVLSFLAFRLRNRELGRPASGILLASSLLLVLTGSVVLCNTLIGRFSPKSRAGGMQKGLIFDPERKLVYRTSEFEFMVETDHLGLRDLGIDTADVDRFRILCFGDSWTFGWGVEPQDAWPKKLMLLLQGRGYMNVEVVNCGQPGKNTTDYLRNMESVLGRLKADLVLIGILQLDDLAQIYERRHAPADNSPVFAVRARGFLYELAESSIGNIRRSLYVNSGRKVVQIREGWLRDRDRIMKGLDHHRRLRFERLDDTVRSMFMSGDLNPTLMKRYIDFPDRAFVFNNPDHPSTREAVLAMGEDLRRMKELCAKHGVKAVFVNLPYNEFTGHKVVRMPTDVAVGFLRDNNRIDSVYRGLALGSGMEYIELTRHFLGLEPKDSFFFKYDGHPTAKGHQEIALFLSRELTDRGLIIE